MKKVMLVTVILLGVLIWSGLFFIQGMNYVEDNLASDARTDLNETEETLAQYDPNDFYVRYYQNHECYEEITMSEEQQIFKLIEILEKHLESAEIDFSFDETGLSGGKITILLK